MVAVRPTAPAASLFGAWSTGAPVRDTGCQDMSPAQITSLMALRSAYRAGMSLTY